MNATALGTNRKVLLIPRGTGCCPIARRKERHIKATEAALQTRTVDAERARGAGGLPGGTGQQGQMRRSRVHPRQEVRGSQRQWNERLRRRARAKASVQVILAVLLLSANNKDVWSGMGAGNWTYANDTYAVRLQGDCKSPANLPLATTRGADRERRTQNGRSSWRGRGMARAMSKRKLGRQMMLTVAHQQEAGKRLYLSAESHERCQERWRCRIPRGQDRRYAAREVDIT